jgi:hypothetical protein
MYFGSFKLWMPLPGLRFMALASSTICNIMAPVAHKVRPRWALFTVSIVSHTRKWVITDALARARPLWACPSTNLATLKMGRKGAEDQRAAEKALELLEHSSMNNMRMRENSPYSRVLWICVGIEKLQVFEAVFRKFFSLFVCSEFVIGHEDSVNHSNAGGADCWTPGIWESLGLK